MYSFEVVNSDITCHILTAILHFSKPISIYIYIIHIYSEHFTLIMLDIDAVRTIDITNANGAVDLNSSLHNEDERVQSTNSR